MGFLLHKFPHFVHALRLFKALRLFFLTNFPGPTVIPCPTSIPDSRVNIYQNWFRRFPDFFFTVHPSIRLLNSLDPIKNLAVNNLLLEPTYRDGLRFLNPGGQAVSPSAQSALPLPPPGWNRAISNQEFRVG